MNVSIQSVWDRPEYGLTEADFARFPVDRRVSFERSRYLGHLQTALDNGALVLPVHAVGLGTFFGTPDGNPPIAANRRDALLVVAGDLGRRAPRLIAAYSKGAFKKRIEVVVPGVDLGQPYDDFFIEDVPIGDVGEIAVQFVHMNMPVFRLAFGYWKSPQSKTLAQNQARAILSGIESCRNG